MTRGASTAGAVASEFERWETGRDTMKVEAKRAAATLADLKRQVRNAKAQLRRAQSQND